MNPKSTAVAEPLEEFLRSKSKGGDESGNYRRNLERCLEDFLEWLADDSRSDGTFADLDERTFRRYARELTGRDLAPGTVRTYYGHISSYVGWCVREGTPRGELRPAQRRDGTAARKRRAAVGRPAGLDRRTSTTDHAARRRATSQRKDERGLDAIREFRDRALVYVLSYSGVRGGEIFADPKDDRRTGLRWADVSLEDRKMTVLAKKPGVDRSIPDGAGNTSHVTIQNHPRSRRGRVAGFPTFHLPTLYETLRTGLRKEDWSANELEAYVDGLTGHSEVFDALRKNELGAPLDQHRRRSTNYATAL